MMSEERRKARIRGIIGEHWHKGELNIEGCMHYAKMRFPGKKGKMNDEGIQRVVNHSYDTKILDILKQIREQFPSGFPDFICSKNGKIFFVEVKTTGGHDIKHQFQPSKDERAVTHRLKEYGYEVRKVGYHVEFEVTKYEGRIKNKAKSS
jgi:hypothetical protein